jgi:molybdate transport system substrate-binding protein
MPASRNLRFELEHVMRPWNGIAVGVAAGCLTVAIACTAADAAEIALVTTGAVEHIMLGLIPSFEQASGHKVHMSVYGTALAVSKVKEGEAADIVLLSPEALGDLAKAGKVADASITPVFRSRVGLAVRAGAPRPDIGSADALKKTLLAAKSIGYSIGPSGEYFSTILIERLGIADALRPKMKQVRGAPVATAVAKGEVEVGIHQVAELMPIPGIELVGALPLELNTIILYATGIATAAKAPDAATALAKTVMLQSAVPVIRKNGMEPF